MYRVETQTNRAMKSFSHCRVLDQATSFFRLFKQSLVLFALLLLPFIATESASAAPTLAQLSAGPLDLKLVELSSSTNSKKFQLQIIPRNGVESLSADLTANVFAIKDPTRLVIDIPNFVAGQQQSKRLNHSEVSRIRLGVHKNKTRVVIDLTSAGSPSYDIRSDAGLGALVVDFTILGAVGKTTPPSTPTPIAIPSPTPKLTAPTIAIEDPVPTPVAEPTISKTPIFTRDSPPTGSVPNITPKSTPSAEPTKETMPSASTIPSLPDVGEQTNTPSLTELPGLPGNTTGATAALVKGIYYQTEKNSDISSVMIDVDGLNTYSLTQRDGNSFELLLEGAKLKGKHLSLPQFPPDTFRGFEVIIANERGSDVVVKIYVEDEVSLTPFIVKGKLWLRAK
jgi:hypothetical protein